MAKMELEIFDDTWPKLRVVGTVRCPDGRILTFEDKVQYDQGYIKFENTLHNMLRPLVDSVVKTRLAQNSAPAVTPNQT